LILLCAGMSHARSYSTTFTATENPISEGGNWVGGQSAGGNLWGDVRTNGTMAYGVSEPTTFGDPTALLTGTWGNVQEATATVRIVTPHTGCCYEVEIRLHSSISASNVNGYEAYCSVSTDNLYCHIARWNGSNGSYCNIETQIQNPQLHDGDVLYARASGTNPVVINLYVNGTLSSTVSDSGATCSPGGAGGPFGGGSPGIGFYDNQSDATFADFGFTSFQTSDGISTVSSKMSGPFKISGNARVK